MSRLQHNLSDNQLSLITIGSVLLIIVSIYIMYQHSKSLQRRYPSAASSTSPQHAHHHQQQQQQQQQQQPPQRLQDEIRQKVKQKDI
ncbi:uncharacterized protein L201_005714 [Kwoniella dendrophila CBS 6074]|uniref:Uncharacterized protein n=1 Tax=Kwoniella dendrophila CBS 6074 TaxID=1295534 RepID=A0AAX4K1K9_9TREE